VKKAKIAPKTKAGKKKRGGKGNGPGSKARKKKA
jgi:hypothetical protein